MVHIIASPEASFIPYQLIVIIICSIVFALISISLWRSLQSQKKELIEEIIRELTKRSSKNKKSEQGAVDKDRDEAEVDVMILTEAYDRWMQDYRPTSEQREDILGLVSKANELLLKMQPQEKRLEHILERLGLHHRRFYPHIKNGEKDPIGVIKNTLTKTIKELEKGSVIQKPQKAENILRREYKRLPLSELKKKQKLLLAPS